MPSVDVVVGETIFSTQKGHAKMDEIAAFENSNQIRHARQSFASHLWEEFVSGSAAGAVEVGGAFRDHGRGQG